MVQLESAFRVAVGYVVQGLHLAPLFAVVVGGSLLVARKLIFVSDDRLAREFGNISGCFSSFDRWRATYRRGNFLVSVVLRLLLMTVCTACQVASPVPTSTPTIPPTSTTVSTSTPPSDEPFTCQSFETSEYVLPFPVGIEYKCIQGYVGRTHHVGVFKYGLDFDMPMGSTVTAARAGHVIFVEGNHSDQDYGTENANVVVVQHEDGTYGRYVHLTKDGVLVEIGQRVTRGDPIGLSGSSGDPGNPHLHFDVTQECPQPDCHTIPICFSNTKPHPAGLVTGESYTSEQY